MRTLSASPIAPDRPALGDDLDNRVVDGIESLRQRIGQRLRFRVGEWQLDRRQGTESVLGFEYTPELAAAVLSGAIRDEGAEEVTGISNVQFNLDADRRLSYYAIVNTIYGVMTLTGVAV